MTQRSDRIRSLASRGRFRIGALLVQPERLTITIAGEEIALEPRMMEVLIALAEHAGEVVSAEQLLIEVWRGTFYGDNPVHKVIAQLRRLVGDDSRAPKYIETIRKRGYRLIAPVSHPEDQRRTLVGDSAWSGRSPYVGLASFDDAHAEVFFGRSRMTADLLAAMRSQIDSQRRFVLLVGASGCGKTSLLRAGAIPLLRQSGGFDGLQSLSIATCDFSGVEAGEVIPRMASALGGWSLDGRPVFASPQAVPVEGEALATRLSDIIRDGIRRLAAREVDANPYAHLLLVIDHAEALVASSRIDAAEREAFSRLLVALCDSPRTLVAMITRSDFYPRLIEAVPELADRKGGDGHLDVLMPRSGEIAQIIRTPAMLAGLSFEEDRQSLSRLDDVLRDAASQHPDALPLLQHTLQALYERRSESGQLGFAAYRDIGGLEGALAHRAEEVFAALPEAARNQLEFVLSQLIAIQPDNDAISGRWVKWDSLDNDDARTLAEAFVRARLFVGELRDDRPGFGVAHEALLRQWPRARDWAQDNRRLLHARARLLRETARWVESGRGNDHLLNAGRPLSEAIEAARRYDDDLQPDERAFLDASRRQQARKRRLRIAATIGLVLLAAISTAFAFIAMHSRDEAERRRADAQQLSDFMLVDLADKLRPLGNLKLLDSISAKALSQLDTRPVNDMDVNDLLNRSRAMRTAGEVMMEQGKLPEALSAFSLAGTAARKAVLRSPDSSEALAESGVTSYWLGYYHYRQRDIAQARKHWQDYLDATERVMQRDSRKAENLVEVSYALNNLGTAANVQGNIAEAMDYFQRSAALKRRALAMKPDDESLRYDLVDTLSWISSGEETRGRLREAASEYAEQIRMLRLLVARKPDAHAWERRLATSLLRSGRLDASLGDSSTAQAKISESIQRLQRLTRLEPDNRVWKRDLAHAHLEAAEISRSLSDDRGEASHLGIARRISESLMREDRKLPVWQRLDALIRFRIGVTQDDAEAMDEAIADLHRLQLQAPGDVQGITAYNKALVERARRALSAGNRTSAERDARTALDSIASTARQSSDPRVLSIWIAAHDLLGIGDRVDKERQRLATTGYIHTN